MNGGCIVKRESIEEGDLPMLLTKDGQSFLEVKEEKLFLSGYRSEYIVGQLEHFTILANSVSELANSGQESIVFFESNSSNQLTFIGSQFHADLGGTHEKLVLEKIAKFCREKLSSSKS